MKAMNYVHSQIAKAKGAGTHSHAWQAVRELAAALGESPDASVRECLFEAEKAAIIADTRIVELENLLEVARRQLVDLGVATSALCRRRAERTK